MAESMSKAGKEQRWALTYCCFRKYGDTQKQMALCQKVPGTGSKGSHWLNLEQLRASKIIMTIINDNMLDDCDRRKREKGKKERRYAG